MFVYANLSIVLTYCSQYQLIRYSFIGNNYITVSSTHIYTQNPATPTFLSLILDEWTIITTLVNDKTVCGCFKRVVDKQILGQICVKIANKNY